MKRDTTFNFSRPAAMLRRGAVILGAGLAAFAFAGGARAQVTGPLATSPNTPTAYESLLFHSGGTAPAPPAAPLLDLPLFAQLQGTPTGVFPNTAAGVATEIPSFLLGNYNPTLPPGATGAANYFPNHFGDGDVYSISGPFNYFPAAVNTVTVDDDTATAAGAGANGFTATAGFANVTITATAAQTDPIAATANNADYHRLPPSTNGSATWTLSVVNGGSYSLYFHIPDNIAGTDGNAELRSTQVVYAIQLGPTATAPIIQATASQTEANSSQYLAGPFQLAPGETVTITLTRDSTQTTDPSQTFNPAASTLNQNNVLDYLIADSMTLQPTIGDVQSTPTVVNTDADPADFLNVKYWGIYVSDTAANQGQLISSGTAQALLDGNAPADTNPAPVAPTFTPQAGATPVFRYGDPAKTQEDGGTLDTASTPTAAGYHKRLIKQLVYFGRSDPSFVFSTTTDDSDVGFTGVSTETDGLGTYAFKPVIGGGATNGAYKRVLAINTPTAASGTSKGTWTLTAPNSAFYFLYVHLPVTATNETRVTDAAYTVTVGTGTPTTYKISQNSPTADSSVLLPTGPLSLTQGETVTVSLTNVTADTLQVGTKKTQVVFDSLTLTTGNGTGAIYCMDGFTGGIVWRFATPGTANGPSAPVFSSPAIAKIHVLVTPSTATTTAVYADKLVVIVGDNNGQVYCLDAIGNGDGTSNEKAIDTASGRPIYFPQPAYGATQPLQVDATGYTPHVGTTSVYWVYRPDPKQPFDLTTHTVKTLLTTNKPDPNSDLPVPAAFGAASPTVFVDPSVPAANLSTTNAKVYVGNTNGVLYALDALGVDPGDPTTHANPTTPSATDYGDKFNIALDLRQDTTATSTESPTPTPQPMWWFTLRGASPNSGANTSSADIESAPALFTHYVPAAGTAAAFYYPTVYIGSAHEEEGTSNVGRLYALDGLVGPSGNSGKTTTPGSLNYNVGQRPQTSTTDTADWSFPDALGTDTYGTGKSSNGKPRPALGNISGSPVVFTNINDTTVGQQTRIYFAANVGLEVPATVAGGTAATVADPRPDDTGTGRIWAVNLDGTVGTTTKNTTGVWAFPVANDPNNAGLDTTPEPSAPIGAFLHATPALGYVQFPSTIVNGDATNYTHNDVIDTAANGVRGNVVPMLYIGTRGVNDTALYAVDIDGGSDADRLIYRVPSPSAAIFQSSPILITNATGDPTNPTLPRGNGGSVLIVADNTLFDFGATPISNPGLTVAGTTQTQAYPLIRENRAFTGFGPISGPAVAASDTTDLLGAAGATGLPTYFGGHTVTDWVYCGDSGTGLCRGITPRDTTDGGIPGGLAGEIPPAANPVSTVDLTATIQTYLAAKGKETGTRGVPTNASPVGDMAPIGPSAPLPVYEWGENVYIRFTNVVPPTPAGSTPLYVLDSSAGTPSSTNLVTAYGNGGPIEFDLSDSDPQNPRSDHARVPPVVVMVLPSDGFIPRTDTSATGNLVDVNGNRWMGAYTYAISDGTGRRNTPGARRAVINATQIVQKYTTPDGTTFTPVGTVTLAATITNGNVVSVLDPTTGTYKSTFNKIPPVDQPRFGILNPLGIRAGGVPLPLAGNTSNAAVQIGDEAGPFRGVNTPPVETYTLNADGTYTAVAPTGGDTFALQALTDGNTIFSQAAPPSSSLGGNPVQFPRGTNDPSGTNLPMHTQVVVTATGQINHNGSGDNADTNPTALPPVGNYGSGTDNGLGGLTSFGSSGAPYAMDLADRSLLVGTNKTLRIKTNTAGDTSRGGMAWNDNTTPVNQASGHDAVVNFLPWETPPTGRDIGLNNSPDYPDIASGNISASLYADDSSGGVSGSLDTSTVVATPPTGVNITTPTTRTVKASVVQVHVSVPQYQPANLQLYKRYAGSSGIAYNRAYQIAPNTPTTRNGISSSSDVVFPMGYVATRRVYVPNAAGRYEAGCAYRDFQVFTGVAPSMSMSMADGTLTVPAPLPAGFGVQTDNYTGLGQFNPYSPSATPTTFQPFFLPVTVHNDGNVNLLNVHLDQKVSNTLPVQSLLLGSDPVDPLSVVPAYDINGITGPTLGNVGTTTIPELPFLVRSSLDTDLVGAFGHNPSSYSVLDTGNNHLYPGATFHKPRVGSGGPTTLFVPDAPDQSVQYFSLLGSPVPGGKPTAATDPNPSDVDINGKQLPYKALPYISLAVPFGTPVGSYYQKIRAFEGLDPTNYSPYFNGGKYSSLVPPQYDGAIGGINGVPGALDDRYLVGSPAAADPGVTLQANVVEDRMTDGATLGALPQIDAGSAGGTAASPAATPDFQPAAFRDPVFGGLAVYWTTGRTGAYTIQGRRVPYTGKAFLPSDDTAAWWGAADVTKLPTTGINSGLSIAQDQPVYNGTAFNYDKETAYAFSVNSNGSANTLFCNPISYTPSPASIGKLEDRSQVSNDTTQTKYGIRGLYCAQAGFTDSLWAFWTGSTRGRTAIYYSGTTPGGLAGWLKQSPLLLPVPAGLTAVSDAAPTLMYAPVTDSTGTTALKPTIEVTYSGLAPDGNTDLYESRYVPDATSAGTLDLTTYPLVTERLAPANGWFQARDVAWSRAGTLDILINNVSVLYTTSSPVTPLFKSAVYDKASGLLVYTGVTVPGVTGTSLVYADLATGRVRFQGTPSGTVTATFNPQARRITTDPRADTGPITFLDPTFKENEAGFNNASVSAAIRIPRVQTDRRWYIWRKAGVSGDAHSATLYLKTQRLTLFLPTPVALDSNQQPIVKVTLGATTVYDESNQTSDVVDVDWSRGRIYFPVSIGGVPTEGQQITVAYTDTGGTTHTVAASQVNAVQWQDEQQANDFSAKPTDTVSGLADDLSYAVPINQIVNENNVAAFLDTDALKNVSSGYSAPDPSSGTANAADYPHKIWLFWNSTRNGTADLYYETINPRF